MLKNWTVKTKQIKNKDIGLIKHFNYLKDKNRPSHYFTEIHDLNNSNDRIKEILNAIESRKAYRKENGLRGGGVSNYATSFVLSLPRDIAQPTAEQWSKICDIALKELSKTVDLTFEEIKLKSVIVLHDEQKSLDKTNHCHILTSNIHNNEVVKSISQFRATHAMKQGFNKGVLEVLGISNYDYMPKSITQIDKPLYVSRNEFAEKKKNQAKEAIKIANAKITKYKLIKIEVEEYVKHFKKWLRFGLNKMLHKMPDEANESKEILDNLDQLSPSLVNYLESQVDYSEEKIEIKNNIKLDPPQRISNRKRRRRVK